LHEERIHSRVFIGDSKRHWFGYDRHTPAGRIQQNSPPVFELIVPNEVTSSSGNLVAHRVLPPLGADFASGTVTTFGGTSFVFVSPARTAELLYEVTAARPFREEMAAGQSMRSTYSCPGISRVAQAGQVHGRLAPVMD